jgi:TonB family protein
VNDAPRPGPGLERDMLDAMKRPVDIYFVAWKLADLPDNSQPAPLGYFVFIDGKFRWDSGVTLADVLGPVAKVSEGGPFLPGVLGVGYPKCLACPRPAFSPEARAVSLQGTVLLTVVVQANGQAGFVKVVGSVGMGLDENAIKAIQNWRFQPAVDSNGTPVSVVTQIQVTYRLLPPRSAAVPPPDPQNK